MHIVMTYLQVCNVRKRDLVEGFLISGIKYKLYWIITSVAYILGLVATFISLFLMNSAQPALLYLVSAFIPYIILNDNSSLLVGFDKYDLNYDH